MTLMKVKLVMMILGVLYWRQCGAYLYLCLVGGDDDVRGVVLETVARRKDKRLPKFMSLGIVVYPDKYNFKLAQIQYKYKYNCDLP